ncbi:T9SS type A sorting domain-containing protein [Sediminibacterium sp.]|uniref:T9SS type A sorting domain-containing protein n=1 Tax=Sediminibacterium sp. TaxID=1917865 RepID=UPI002733D11B|nr:T9SS type A sorting domain-containing protein [Sediminibacterium sp.]MDP3567321.1 T9SS type A sorting domain-containing protein [Sediminibacterium sp.]
MKKLLFFIVILFLKQLAFCQEWTEMMHQPNTNLYDVQKSFNDYWQDKDKTVKSRGYKVFKRWEHHVEPRVYPTGDLSLLSKNAENFNDFLENHSITSGNKFTNSNATIASTTWSLVGPLGAMTGSATNGLPRKAGRDNFITFHPTNANTYWVGAPVGGLWKTTNNGTSWATSTDNLNVIGCTDLAIDPSNTNIMYLATGDGYAGDCPSIGVLKSIDGGVSWNTTGLTAGVGGNFLIRRLIINPSNPLILIAATNGGVYRTINGGTNWTQVSTVNSYDCEFKPGDPNTVYSCGAYFYRSTNGGASFTQVTTGIATAGSNRMAIAVTTNVSGLNYVYVVASSSASSGLLGVYRSTDSGVSFSSMATTPDLLANSCAGTGGGGQGWYDLAIAASPLNANEVVVGGVNHWRSLNGGSTWTNIGCWNSTGANPPYVHADVHELEYNSTGVLYSTNDGGIYRYTGSAWTDITSTMNIAQIYRIGLSGTTPNYWITGHQDNGSNIYNGTTYNASYPGDGLDCFVDRTNNNILFTETPYGGLVRSTNGGASWAGITAGLAGSVNWLCPWKQDPLTSTTIYCGRSTIWKSLNQGTTWATTAALPVTAGAVTEFAVAPSNNLVMYVLKNSGVFKTVNGGTSWTNVTTGIPVGTAAPTYVTIDGTDPNTAWVTLSGYSAANKVFMTTNGGTSWTNVTSNLPNLPANCSVYQTGTNGRVYVGMDVGVYYKDIASPNWTLYNLGLPNTNISDLEISPASPTKLRAATYGRGVYEVDVIPTALPPVSGFSYAGTVCSGVPTTFNDASTNSPTIWNWSVIPATGVTINTAASQNPIITFANAGTYSVSLQANNGFGPGNVSTQTVIVTATPTVALTGSVQTICSGNSANLTASGATTYSWNTGATTANINPSPMTTTNYTVTGYNGTCSSFKTATITVSASPTVNVTNASICTGSSATVTASGATTYSWNTGATSAAISVTPAITTIYTVTGTTGICTNIKTTTVTVNSTPTVVVNSATICSGYAANLTASGATTYSWSTGATSSVINPSPIVTTVYTVTGTNGVCASNKTTTVSVIPSPTVNASSNNSVICVGQQVILSATGANTYTWQPGSVSGATVSDTPAATQTYTVSGSGANGCVGVNTVMVTVSLCTGIAQLNGNAIKYSVYPNPAKDEVTLNINSFKLIEIGIELIDASGKLIVKQVVKFDKTRSDQKINISSVSSGVYFIKLISNEGDTQTIKLIKE